MEINLPIPRNVIIKSNCLLFNLLALCNTKSNQVILPRPSSCSACFNICFDFMCDALSQDTCVDWWSCMTANKLIIWQPPNSVLINKHICSNEWHRKNIKREFDYPKSIQSKRYSTIPFYLFIIPISIGIFWLEFSFHITNILPSLTFNFLLLLEKIL